MTKFYFLISILVFCGFRSIVCQTNDDTLTMPIDEVVITATRSGSILNNTASNITVVNKPEIDLLPLQKIDNILELTSGVNVNRPLGIYSIRPVVNLRGIDGSEQSRTLVLLNNVPVNTSDEGGVNWNRLNPIRVERIEILKGPNSSIYGNNAMGGVINIITRKPIKKIESNIGISYGTYNTRASDIYIGSKLSPDLSFSISGFYQKSDGYNPVPPKKRSTPDYSIPRYLNEGNISTNFNYIISTLLNIDIQYDYYNDHRGEGEKIIAEKGEYRQFKTNFCKIGFSGNSDKFHYNGNLFYQREDYLRLDERQKDTIYSRFDVESERNDFGIYLLSYYQLRNHRFSLGLENRKGSVDGGDFYATSDDFIINRGTLINNGIFGIYEYHSSSDKFHFMGSIRFDNVRFRNGTYLATGNNVDYWLDYNPDLPNRQWSHLSPKLSAKYKFSESFDISASYSHGFRASILDDLCRSGWMWVGPKIANPDLKPEYIDNFEAGLKKSFQKLNIEYAVYHIIGKDFLYYVSTGEKMFGRDVYKRENVGAVKITGTEFAIEYEASQGVVTRVNYTYNDSKIVDFNHQPELEGKSLKYSPKNKVSASLLWTNKVFNCGISFLYKDKQYSTDDNSSFLTEYCTIGFQVSKSMLNQNLRLTLSIMDLLDNEHMETDYYISPGRLTTFKIGYRFER